MACVAAPHCGVNIGGIRECLWQTTRRAAASTLKDPHMHADPPALTHMRRWRARALQLVLAAVCVICVNLWLNLLRLRGGRGLPALAPACQRAKFGIGAERGKVCIAQRLLAQRRTLCHRQPQGRHRLTRVVRARLDAGIVVLHFR